METDQQDKQDELLESKVREETNEIVKSQRKEALRMFGQHSQKEEPSLVPMNLVGF